MTTLPGRYSDTQTTLHMHAVRMHVVVQRHSQAMAHLETNDMWTASMRCTMFCTDSLPQERGTSSTNPHEGKMPLEWCKRTSLGPTLRKLTQVATAGSWT